MKKIGLLSLFAGLTVLFSACSGGERSDNAETANGAADTLSAPKTEAAVETETQTESEVKEVTKITCEIDPDKPIISLTFDDGPNTDTTNEVLDLLVKYNVRASFFLIGNNINDESAETVKRAYDLGCEINNHSKTHSDMTKMTAEDIKAEIDFVSDKVREITGEPTTFFRPPYIAVNNTMYESIDMPFIAGIGCNDWEDSVTADMRVKKSKDSFMTA